MVVVKNNTTGAEGITVGRRKDGSRAVLYNHQNDVHWFSAELFASWFTTQEA
jgi:hypothetical protein